MDEQQTQPTPPADALLAEVEALCAKATPEPWEAGRLLDDQTNQALTKTTAVEYVKRCLNASMSQVFFGVVTELTDGTADVCHTGNGPNSQANAHFIAASRNLLPKLAAAYRKALSEQERLKGCWLEAIGRECELSDELSETKEQLEALRHDALQAHGTAQALEQERRELDETVKSIMDERTHGDEKHCTCAPLLRIEIQKLEASIPMKERAAFVAGTVWADGSPATSEALRRYPDVAPQKEARA